MLCLLFAASLNLLAVANDTPHKAEVKPKATADKAEPAAEEPAKPAEKPAKRKLPTPAVPVEEHAEAPAPVRRVAKPAPRPAAHAAPVAAAPAGPVALTADARAARLEAENAKLRQQLAQAGSPGASVVSDAASALQELSAGNQRFVTGARVRTLLSGQDSDLRHSLATGQAPFAVVITCSDSRLVDNFIFDQELGRLFTIREAGNAPDLQGLASVEYAVEHLGSKLVVVMGHTACGAVKAVHDAHGKPLPGNLWSLQAAMSGLLESTPEDPNEEPAVHMYHLSEHNAQLQAQVILDRSEIVRELVGKGKVKVVPAMYDLGSGRVTFLASPGVAHASEAGHH